jgi:hypothetical protein
MNIKIFMQTAHNISEHNVLMHAGAGLQSWLDANPIDEVTHQLDYEYSDSYVACDLAVFIGSWKPREKGHHAIRSSIAQNAKQFICVETALLGRKTTEANTHYRIGINGFLNNAATWPYYDPAAGQERLQQLEIEWQGWNCNQDGHILLALQLPSDASLRGADINEWALETVRTIRKVSDRPIVIRSHPMISDRGLLNYSPLAMVLLSEQLYNVTYSDGSTKSWAEDLAGAYCTVTFSSGLAIDSVVSGVPTIACDPGNFAFNISSNFAEDINLLKFAEDTEIEDWLQQLALNQWTIDEMRTVETWAQYLNVIHDLACAKENK